MIPNKSIDLNEAGVAMIKAGRYDRAGLFLTNALRRFRLLGDKMNKYEESDGPILDQWILQKERTNHLTKYEMKRLGEERSSSRSIYKEPITVPKHTATVSFAAMSSCIIFNLALTEHLSAESITTSSSNNKKNRQEKSRRQLKLKKASKLYELAYNAQHEYTLDEKPNIYFTMAIVNNLGLIHRDLNEFDTSNHYFDQLTKMLMFVVDNSRDNMGMLMMQEDRNLEVFFRNAFSTSIKESYTALAA